MREGRRYAELKLLERSGFISNVRLQVPFELLPNQKNAEGKVIERKVSYIADFVYFDNEKGCYVVEDAKGVRTEVYRLKKKLMLAIHGIEIKEV